MQDESILKSILKDGASSKTMKPKDFQVTVADIDHDEVLNMIQSRINLAASYREPFEDEWRSAFMAWMQKLDQEAERSWESKRFMPLILQQVETALPVIFSSVFNGRDIWNFYGKNPEGTNASAAMDKLVHWQARGPSRLEQSFDEASFWAVLFGTGVYDVRWSFIEATQMRAEVEVDPATGKKHKVIGQGKVTVEDFPIVRAVNPLNIWLAPHGQPGDSIPWAIERMETSKGEIKRSCGHGHFDLDAVEEWDENWEPVGGGAENDEMFGSANVDLLDQWLAETKKEEREWSRAEDPFDDDKPIFVLEYRSKTERITVAPGGYIIGYSHNPYMHGKTGYVVHQFIPIPGCPYGRGLGTILFGHQTLLNENINLYMDVQRISAMGPVIVNRSSVSALDRNFKLTPNKQIFARDINNAVKRLELPPPTGQAMQMDQHLQADAMRTTGYSDQSMGFSGSGVGTATESTILQNNAQTRTYMHVKRLQRTVGLIGKMLVSLNQQFMTEEQIVSVIGEDGLDYVKVEPWEIVGEVVVEATTKASRALPGQRAQQLIGAMQVFLPMIQQGGMTPMVARMLREVLKSIEVEDVDSLIPKDAGMGRDPLIENVALERGVEIAPSEFEDFQSHMQAHASRLAELKADMADPWIISSFERHIQATAQMAQQAGAKQFPQGQAPGAGAQGDQMGGGDEVRQQATGAGAAVGSQGVPGQAAPGPQAAPGRQA